MTDVTMSLDDTLELDTIIKESNKPIQPINSVKHDIDGSSHKNQLQGIQTNTVIFNPPKSGTYTIKINGQELNIKVTDSVIIPDSVDNFWPMNDDSTFLKDTKSGRNLSLTGGSWSGDVLELDGDNDFASNGNTYFDALEDFSLFGWFRRDGNANRAFAGSYDTSGNNRSWWIGSSDSFINVNTSDDGANFERHNFPTNLSTDTWYSFAVSRDSSSGEVDVWRDATSLGSVNLDSGILYDNQKGIFIGQRSDGAFFDGNLRAFAFAKNHIYTDGEVQTLHNKTNPV